MHNGNKGTTSKTPNNCGALCIRNAGVAGSSPASGTITNQRLSIKDIQSAKGQVYPIGRWRRVPLIETQRTRHGKTVYYARAKGKPRIRLPDEYGTPEFWTAYASALSVIKQWQPGIPLPEIIQPTVILRGRVGQAVKKSVGAARQRAKERNLPFDLDYEWAIREIERQNFCCAVTGIKLFSRWTGPACQRDPMTPSIDRIIPSDGYTQANCRIVLLGVNTMFLDWGEDLFFLIAKSYLRQRKIRKAGKP